MAGLRRRMWFVSCALGLLLTLQTAPAFGDLYTFTIDPTKSSITFTDFGVGTPFEGTFSLDLAGSSPTWEGSVALGTVSAVNTAPVVLVPGLVEVAVGGLQLTDFDDGTVDTGTLVYDGNTHIATGVVNTELKVFVAGGAINLDGWQGKGNWVVEVSDDNWIGATVPGPVEARLKLTDSITDPNVGTIRFEVQLVGAAVPEPATWALLLMGGLFMSIVPARRAWTKRRRPAA